MSQGIGMDVGGKGMRPFVCHCFCYSAEWDIDNWLQRIPLSTVCPLCACHDYIRQDNDDGLFYNGTPIPSLA